MVMYKRINNNVIIVIENEEQVIVTGKGLGFQLYPGDEVDPERVDKKYYAPANMTINQIASIIMQADHSSIMAVEAIVDIAQKEIESLSGSLFFTLLDHLNYALKRVGTEQEIISPLEWEIKKFYPREYLLGSQAVDLIVEKKQVVLPKAEAAFFALHFLNAQLNSTTGDEVFELTELTNSILKLVKYQFKCDFDEDTISYQRFITHVKYFLMRQIKGEYFSDQDDGLAKVVIDKYPKEYECALIIENYLNEKKDWRTSETEKMYLILHIKTLISKTFE